MVNLDELLTRSEAAALLKVKLTTIDAWRKKHWRRDMHYVQSGKTIRFYRSCIYNWMINRAYPDVHEAWLLDRHSPGRGR